MSCNRFLWRERVELKLKQGEGLCEMVLALLRFAALLRGDMAFSCVNLKKRLLHLFVGQAFSHAEDENENANKTIINLNERTINMK